MPQCVPCTVYETMNVHEQTKIVGLHALANGLFLTLILIGIKMRNQIGTDYQASVFYVSPCLYKYITLNVI